MRALRRGFVLLMCRSGAAIARSSVPVVNLERNVIPPKAGSARTLEDVQRAMTAGGQRACPWSTSEGAPGRMKRTPMTSRHVAVVEVPDDTGSSGICDADSSNLHYKKTGTQELIHAHCNGWVQTLQQNIGRQLL
jgi:hypothetical protein